MCFSAQASFAVAGGLSVLGLLSVGRAQTKNQVAFAAIPLFFAVQQFFEGIVWLVQQYGLSADPFLAIGTYGFLFFALLFWPIWVPFSLWLLESRGPRKRWLFATLLLGVIWSLYLANLMLAWPISTQVLDGNIVYSILMPAHPLADYAIIPYALATIGSFFFSSTRAVWGFGSLAAILMAVALWYWYAAFISIWCFFAAVISLGVYWIMGRIGRSSRPFG